MTTEVVMALCSKGLDVSADEVIIWSAGEHVALQLCGQTVRSHTDFRIMGLHVGARDHEIRIAALGRAFWSEESLDCEVLGVVGWVARVEGGGGVCVGSRVADLPMVARSLACDQSVYSPTAARDGRNTKIARGAVVAMLHADLARL